MREIFKRIRITTALTKKQAYVFIGAVIVFFGAFYTRVTTEGAVILIEEPVEIRSEDMVAGVSKDLSNYMNLSNAEIEECEAVAYPKGFSYYQIPEEYIESGGDLPEEVQIYLWNLCEERELDYHMVLALIERESGYKQGAIGDDDRSYGYTQIYKEKHLERMKEEDVQELLDPYGNLRVCTNFLQEIQNKYGSNGADYVLMVYNMGEQRASKLWSEGVYSSEYSREIRQRAQEIEQELQDKQDVTGV